MRQKSNSTPASSEALVRNIRRATRKHHAAEEKIRIVLEGVDRHAVELDPGHASDDA
jgi:transposase